MANNNLFSEEKFCSGETYSHSILLLFLFSCLSLFFFCIFDFFGSHLKDNTFNLILKKMVYYFKQQGVTLEDFFQKKFIQKSEAWANAF